MLKLFAQLFPGMRVDAPDASFIARDSQLAILRQVMTGAVAEGTIGKIIKGFACSINGSTLTVTGGRALLSLRLSGEAMAGVLVEDEDSQSVSISGLSGTKGVYITARLRSREGKRRVFWDALAAPATEFLRSVPTRESLTWSVRVATNSPGTEWTKISDLNMTGPALTPTREYLFDGNEGVTGITNWGAGGDRTASTGLTLYFFARAVMRQLQDIIGQSPLNWKSVPPRSITALNNEKLERNGSIDITGVQQPSGDNTINLGATGRRFATFFARLGELGTLSLGEALLGTYANALLARLNIRYRDGDKRTRILHLEKDASPAGYEINVYAVRGGGYGAGLYAANYVEVAINCSIDTSDEWSYSSNGLDATVYAFTPWGMGVVRRAPFLTTPWVDDGTAWTVHGQMASGPVPFLYTAGDVAAAGEVGATGLVTGARFVPTGAAPTDGTFNPVARYTDNNVRFIACVKVLGAGTGGAAFELVRELNFNLGASVAAAGVNNITLELNVACTGIQFMAFDASPDADFAASQLEIKVVSKTTSQVVLKAFLGGNLGTVMDNRTILVVGY